MPKKNNKKTTKKSSSKKEVKETKLNKEVKEKEVKEIKNTSSNSHNNIIDQEVGPMINDNMMRYSISTLTARALPDVIDGFIPGQRCFIWGAKQAHADGEKTIKSATIVGEVMGKYHPHGDKSIYGTGCRMVDSALHLNVPFMRGKGGFGKHYDSNNNPAASRYTEMALSQISKDLINECVKYHPNNMIDNFDGTHKLPRYISAPFPMVLANAQEGIAVGFACKFGSFNVNEICEATKIVIKNYKKSDKELLKEIKKVMPTMDFPTGGETCIDDEQINNLYLTGEGQITCRVIFENIKEKRVLKIKEVPYSTDIQAIMKAVMNMVDAGKITEISNIKNLDGKTGFDLSIYYKTGTDIEELKKKLYALTPCQSTLNVKMYVVNHNAPMMMGPISCIKAWLEHRKLWVKESLEGQIKELKDKLHLLEALQAILLDIDKAIKIIRQSKSDEESLTGLMKSFKIDRIQAEYVSNIKLINLNKDYILNRTKDINDIKKNIKDLENRLKNIDQEIINDLDDAKKKYGQERRTKIVDKWEELPIFAKNSKPEVKLDGESTLFCSADAVKRVPPDSGAKAFNGATKYDNVPNSGELLIFTNTSNVFKIVIGTIPNNNQIKLGDIKKIKKKVQTGMQATLMAPLLDKHKIVIIFDNGKAVKIPTDAWKTTGPKTLFPKGINPKANIEFITMIDKDKIIDVNGKKLDTSKIKEVGNKTGQGAKFKYEK